MQLLTKPFPNLSTILFPDNLFFTNEMSIRIEIRGGIPFIAGLINKFPFP